MSQRSGSPLQSQSLLDPESTTPGTAARPGEGLRPGIYHIINNVEPNQTFDLSGYDRDLQGILGAIF